jgi:hypothetical protein
MTMKEIYPRMRKNSSRPYFTLNSRLDTIHAATVVPFSAMKKPAVPIIALEPSLMFCK